MALKVQAEPGPPNLLQALHFVSYQLYCQKPGLVSQGKINLQVKTLHFRWDVKVSRRYVAWEKLMMTFRFHQYCILRRINCVRVARSKDKGGKILMFVTDEHNHLQLAGMIG